MSEDAKQYLKEVRLAFPIAYKDEKRFLADLTDSVSSYGETHPNATKEDYYERFGEPKEVALGYYQETSVDVYFGMMRRSRWRRLITGLVVAALIIGLLIVTAFCIHAQQTYKNATGAYVIEEIIEDEGENQ